jgi:hypothetical protein
MVAPSKSTTLYIKIQYQDINLRDLIVIVGSTLFAQEWDNDGKLFLLSTWKPQN